MKRLVKVVFILLGLTFSVSAFDYSGTWYNATSSDTIPKFIVKQDGTIRGFGKCHPTDCDWGSTYYTKVRNGILASWKSNTGHKVLLIQPVGTNRVRVVAKYLYCDNRADKVKTFFFKKRLPVVDNSLKFIGNWSNENPNTRGITKVQIFKSNGKVYVHIWGKCHPADCDWGSKEGFFTDRLLRVNWNQGFVNREIIIKGVGYAGGKYNRIQIKTISRYNDNRGTRTDVEYLQRN